MVHLSPQILSGLYAVLRGCQPFSRWGLPQADEIRFVVNRNRNFLGYYSVTRGKHQIEVSGVLCTQLQTALVTVAHEMCHLRDRVRGRAKGHGASFKRSAKTVCRLHGWDVGAF